MDTLFSHREALAAKHMSPELHQILAEVLKIVNFMKGRPVKVKERLFSILYNEMGSAYESSLFHTEVRWLSRGRVLA